MHIYVVLIFIEQLVSKHRYDLNTIAQVVGLHLECVWGGGRWEAGWGVVLISDWLLLALGESHTAHS